jgi:hypothetical protein
MAAWTSAAGARPRDQDIHDLALAARECVLVI